MTAIRIHPENRKLFEFRGKPLALLCATEHYGAVINRPFRYERYLAAAAAKGQTLSRLFCLFRELQAPVNPYSPCKPESPDFIAPFPRTGPGRGLWTASPVSTWSNGTRSISSACTAFSAWPPSTVSSSRWSCSATPTVITSGP